MKIIMNVSAPGSIDGIKVSDYVAGVEYDLTASPGARSLAAAFVGAGMAVEAKVESATVPPEPVITMTADQSDARDVSELDPAADEVPAEVAPVEPEAKPQAKPGKRK